MKMNLNDQVKVVLNPYGREILQKHYLAHLPPDMAQDAYNRALLKPELTYSLWEIMQIFGQVLYMGNNKIPFVNNEIEILNEQ